MTIDDLKVTDATIGVSNEFEETRVYSIQAKFNVVEGELIQVHSGSVVRRADQVQMASFATGYGGENNKNVTFFNEANENNDTACEVLELINEYIQLAKTKAKEEFVEEN